MDNMTEQISEVDAVVISLNEIQDDGTVPRNVRAHIQNIISTLKNETELSINVNKALNTLGDIANDTNIQSYTRAQIWNIMSILEKLH